MVAVADTLKMSTSTTYAVCYTEGGYDPCADEGQMCTCSGTVVYGRKYVSGKPGSGSTTTISQMQQTTTKTLEVAGTIKCGNSPFGGDPMVDYHKYCLCLRNSDAGASAIWADTGIRLQVSKITTIQYATRSTSFPVREWISTNAMLATNRIPNMQNAILTYFGDLDAYKWLAVVDASLNSNNPCVEAAVAGAASSATNSQASELPVGRRM
jgi:hypothetical protein